MSHVRSLGVLVPGAMGDRHGDYLVIENRWHKVRLMNHEDLRGRSPRKRREKKMAQPQTEKTSSKKGGTPPVPPKVAGANASKTSGAPSTDDYKDAEGFILPAGYWIPGTGSVHGKLVGAYEARQKSGQGKGKLRKVYLVKLYEPCLAKIKTEGANGSGGLEEGELECGDLCAIFDSAGLRALNNLQDCSVKITRHAEKKPTSNGNLMWMFDVKYKGERKTLQVREAFEPSNERDDEASDPESDPDLF